MMKHAKWLVASAGLALLGCGGAGQDESIAAPPVTVAPVPPTAVQTPAPSLPEPSKSIAGAMPGGLLGGGLACVRDPVAVDASARVTALNTLTGASIGNQMVLFYAGKDRFSLDVNGFGGSRFEPADKQVSSNAAYAQFANATQGEFFLFESGGPFGSSTFATLGMYNYAGLCFFAVGVEANSLPTVGVGDYFAGADGVARVGGQTLRVFGTTGNLDVQYASQVATLTLTVVGRGDPFGAFTARPAVELTTVTANLRVRGYSFESISVSGSNGYTGTVSGFFVGNEANASGVGGSGAVFTFELRNAQGDMIVGAVAAERNLI